MVPEQTASNVVHTKKNTDPVRVKAVIIDCMTVASLGDRQPEETAEAAAAARTLSLGDDD